MAVRDVDSVDPATTQKHLPESIRLAERWRLIGMRLKNHSPELLAEVLEMLVVSRVLCAEHDENITESYFVT